MMILSRRFYFFVLALMVLKATPAAAGRLPISDPARLLTAGDLVAMRRALRQIPQYRLNGIKGIQITNDKYDLGEVINGYIQIGLPTPAERLMNPGIFVRWGRIFVDALPFNDARNLTPSQYAQYLE